MLHTSRARAGVLLRVAAAAALLDGEICCFSTEICCFSTCGKERMLSVARLYFGASVAIWRPLMCIINHVQVCDKLGDLMPYQPEGGWPGVIYLSSYFMSWAKMMGKSL